MAKRTPRLRARFQSVEVYWKDAASLHGWRDPEDVRRYGGLTACRSTGYLTHVDGHLIQIAQSRHDRKAEPGIMDRWADILTIPRSQVQRIRLLR